MQPGVYVMTSTQILAIGLLAIRHEYLGSGRELEKLYRSAEDRHTVNPWIVDVVEKSASMYIEQARSTWTPNE